MKSRRVHASVTRDLHALHCIEGRRLLMPQAIHGRPQELHARQQHRSLGQAGAVREDNSGDVQTIGVTPHTRLGSRRRPWCPPRQPWLCFPAPLPTFFCGSKVGHDGMVPSIFQVHQSAFLQPQGHAFRAPAFWCRIYGVNY